MGKTVFIKSTRDNYYDLKLTIALSVVAFIITVVLYVTTNVSVSLVRNICVTIISFLITTANFSLFTDRTETTFTFDITVMDEDEILRMVNIVRGKFGRVDTAKFNKARDWNTVCVYRYNSMLRRGVSFKTSYVNLNDVDKMVSVHGLVADEFDNINILEKLISEI